MKLRTKILSGFLILAVMLACAGVLSIFELLSIGSSVKMLISDNYKSIIAAKAMIDALETEDSGVLLMVSGKWQKGRETAEQGDRAFRKAFEIAKNNITIPGEDRCVDRIASHYQTYRDLWMGPLAQPEAQRTLDWYFDGIHGALQNARQSVEALMMLNDETLYRTASDLQNRAQRAIMPGIVAILSALIFVVVFNYFINYYVVRPIKALAREVTNSVRLRGPINIEVETRDEIHDLASAIKKLATERPR